MVGSLPITGKATLWWEEIKTMRKIDEQQVMWQEFQKHFKDKYITKCYYDEKAKEFHELRLGALTMDEYVKQFISLLRYVPYMQEEKDKIQQFIRSLPNFMKEKLEFDYPRMMDDAGISKTATHQPPKQPLQCWGCGESHYYKNFLRKARTEQFLNMQEASIVGDIARSMPRINVALDNHQAEYQPTMTECEGMIVDQPVSILFDPSASLSYISPKPVEKCQLQSNKFNKSWLVQLATRTKRKVSAKTKNYHITVLGKPIHVDLNILPLGLYDVLIGMDWLEGCPSLVDCKEKSVSYLTDSGKRKEIQEINKSIKLHPIIANHLRRCIRKGYQIYVFQVGYNNDINNMTSLENIPIIQDFVDVFPESIPRLPPRHDIDFTIELVPRAALVSKAPYHMRTLELTELKMQLQELLDKGNFHPSVSP
eukprot:PITA_10510